MKVNNKSWIILIFGIAEVLAVYLVWCLLTVAYRNSIIYGLALIGAFCTWLIYSKMYSMSVGYKGEHIQLCVFNIIFAACNLTILLFSLIRKADDINNWILLIHIGWVITCFVLFWFVDKRKSEISIWAAWKKMQVSKKTVLCIIIFALVIIVLSLDSDMLQFKWDGLLYYKTCMDLSLYSISNLAIYGHIAQTYGIFVRLAVLIFGNVATAMMVMNIVLLLCGTAAFYKTLRLVLPKQDKLMCGMGTLIFAFSPFCLGMVNYHNLDFYLQCIFPIVIYFTISRQWIFQFVVATLFCFTKEPAVIIYGGFCLGVVLSDCLNNAEASWLSKIKRIFATKHYYSMALPGIIWIGTFLLLGPWSAGEGGIALDFAYIFEKLKVLYIFNFNWLLILIVIIALIKRVISKEKGQDLKALIIPLVFSQGFFSLFSCLFKTVNHPRYTDSNVVTLSLLAVIAISYLFRNKLSYVVMGGVSVIMLVSSFWTIDPVSKQCFTTVNVGTAEMLTTMIPYLGDGMIYNKQMLWSENVMNQAFADAVENDSCILLPALEDSTYFFDGMAEVANVGGGYQIDTYYWVNGRRDYYGGNNADNLMCIQISEKADFAKLKEAIGEREIDFIYFDNIGEEKFVSKLSQFTILETVTYQYRGWKLNRIRFQL